MFILVVAVSSAQNYTPKDAGSSVAFAIKNFGLTVNGTFRGLQGNVLFNPNNVTASVFNVTVSTATVNTGNSSRDNHLRKDEYFNAATFPTISFVSTKVSNSNRAGTYIVEGVLTIKGTKKNISFPFTASPNADGYLFSGNFSINRRDFKVGSSSMILSDNLSVTLNVQAKKA